RIRRQFSLLIQIPVPLQRLIKQISQRGFLFQHQTGRLFQISPLHGLRQLRQQLILAVRQTRKRRRSPFLGRRRRRSCCRRLCLFCLPVPSVSCRRENRSGQAQH